MDSVRVTQKRADLLRISLAKQAQAIVNSPRHTAQESDASFWMRMGRYSPMQTLENRMVQITVRTDALRLQLYPDDVRISDQLVQYEEQLLEDVRNLNNKCGRPEAMYTCGICNSSFEDAAALRQHNAKKHSKERLQASATKFDRHLHGTNGMPICSGCGAVFKMWFDLKKHITENHCQGKLLVSHNHQQSVLQMAEAGAIDCDKLNDSSPEICIATALRTLQAMDADEKIFQGLLPPLPCSGMAATLCYCHGMDDSAPQGRLLVVPGTHRIQQYTFRFVSGALSNGDDHTYSASGQDGDP